MKLKTPHILTLEWIELCWPLFAHLIHAFSCQDRASSFSYQIIWDGELWELSIRSYSTEVSRINGSRYFPEKIFPLENGNFRWMERALCKLSVRELRIGIFSIRHSDWLDPRVVLFLAHVDTLVAFHTKAWRALSCNHFKEILVRTDKNRIAHQT